MGIPSFFSQLVRSHPACIKEIEAADAIDSLYMDSNSIIYDCVAKIRDLYRDDDEFEQMVCEAVLEKICEYIELLNPRELCFVAFDGVAPVAKLDQQRNRRYKSVFELRVHEKIIEQKIDTWNTSSITPGTKFMNNLMVFLHENLSESMCSTKKIIISDSNCVGEGEHKIFEHIRSNTTLETKHQVNVIYGLDADLIMLTLNHLSFSPNLYLFRETPHFISQIDSSLEPEKLYSLDIPQLAVIIAQEMGKYRFVEKGNSRVINDYIFLCFLLGNDFMPHFPSINIRSNGIDTLLVTYRNVLGNTNQFLTHKDKINWNQVRKLFEALKQDEQAYLQQEHKRRDHYEQRPIHNKSIEDKKNKFTLIPIKNREAEKYIDPWTSGWESRYYTTLCEFSNNSENVKGLCINYLEALEWTLHYYTTGCKDWRWSYKYCYPPLIKDLCRYIPCFSTEFVAHKQKQPISSRVQLSYVLPLPSLGLLGEDLRCRLLAAYPEQYRLDYTIKWSYCKYMWEAHVEMPAYNLEDLEKFVNTFES